MDVRKFFIMRMIKHLELGDEMVKSSFFGVFRTSLDTTAGQLTWFSCALRQKLGYMTSTHPIFFYSPNLS